MGIFISGKIKEDKNARMFTDINAQRLKKACHCPISDLSVDFTEASFVFQISVTFIVIRVNSQLFIHSLYHG